MWLIKERTKTKNNMYCTVTVKLARFFKHLHSESSTTLYVPRHMQCWVLGLTSLCFSWLMRGIAWQTKQISSASNFADLCGESCLRHSLGCQSSCKACSDEGTWHGDISSVMFFFSISIASWGLLDELPLCAGSAQEKHGMIFFSTYQDLRALEVRLAPGPTRVFVVLSRLCLILATTQSGCNWLCLIPCRLPVHVLQFKGHGREESKNWENKQSGIFTSYLRMYFP